MSEERPKRLDDSLSQESLQKSLTGDLNISIDTTKITISPSGSVVPSTTTQDSDKQNTTKGK